VISALAIDPGRITGYSEVNLRLLTQALYNFRMADDSSGMCRARANSTSRGVRYMADWVVGSN